MRRGKFLFAVIPALFAWLVAPGAITHLEASSAAQAKEIPDQNVWDLRAVTVTFGIRDPKPAVWDGSVDISAGTIEKIVGHHFTEAARVIDKQSWNCSTHPWPSISFDLGPQDRMTPYPSWVQSIGITIHYRAPDHARLKVKTAQGDFEFKPAEIQEPEGIFPLGSRVSVHRTPVVVKLTDEKFEDDYPAIAADGKNLWVAWQGFNNLDTKGQGDLVFARQYRDGRWVDPVRIVDTPSDIFMTAIAATGGKVLVAWSEHRGEDWHIMARLNQGSGFGSVEQVTTGSGHHLFHRVVADKRGGFHLVYQAWKSGRSKICLKSLVGGGWGAELELSDSTRGPREDDWMPAAAVDQNGTVWVAWDSYKGGSYNIFLRSVRNGTPGQIRQITSSKRFHANPSLAVDKLNRIWLAWDEAPENWGKDYGFLVAKGTPIYQSRTVRVAIYDHGRLLAPRTQPGDISPVSDYYRLKRYFHSPKLLADAEGRMWVFVRPMSDVNWARSIAAHGGKWEVFASYYDGDAWSDLFSVPDSVGRNGAGFEAAADSEGNVFLVLVSDHRLWGGSTTGAPPGNHDLMFAEMLRIDPSGQAELAPWTAEPPAKLSPEPFEAEQIAQIRRYEVRAQSTSYRIYRGDLHRHTEVSRDGASDGTLLEAYRYALDAADLDFLAVTDHQSGGQLYTWWRIGKFADMFNVPGYFTAIYATERSLSYPNGHRNLFFPNRWVPILPVGPEERLGEVSSGSVVYPFLRKHKGLASSHTSNTDMGTDWRDNDRELEPLVEIYQGIRTSAEHEGAPLAMSRERPELWVGGFRPDGFVWNAWEKGYKLGVQASSDHLSTHRSYACLIASDLSRPSLFEAMRRRHSYAATSNILLDVRLTDGRTIYLQGDEAVAKSRPTISIHAIGAAQLTNLHVIRDNQYVYSSQPANLRVEMDYRDDAVLCGEHYYYVRVEQDDANAAWSSPIWIQYPCEEGGK